MTCPATTTSNALSATGNLVLRRHVVLRRGCVGGLQLVEKHGRQVGGLPAKCEVRDRLLVGRRVCVRPDLQDAPTIGEIRRREAVEKKLALQMHGIVGILAGICDRRLPNLGASACSACRPTPSTTPEHRTMARPPALHFVRAPAKSRTTVLVAGIEGKACEDFVGIVADRVRSR